MTDDLERARPADREQAIATVEAAHAAGRIVDHDRALRIGQIRAAGRRGEVHALVRDLPALPHAPQRPPVRTPPAPLRRRRSPGRLLAVLAVGAALVLGVVTTITTALVARSPDTVTATESMEGPVERPAADLLSRHGYADLVAAVEQKTGRREAFQLVVYPEEATVALPVDRRSRRQMTYSWDGKWSHFGGKGTSTSARFSLDDVDGGLLRRMVTKARRQVEDATIWYAVVRPPQSGVGGSVIAFATNDFGETATVPVELDPERRNP
ncbi:DUF1707 SHOCT-like domain-containing protein [Nocardioides sp. LHG3406-4]|uniref:DUF1707 SHOCT-like domain-containing protein n=1 Tax=Nocardioides sp. LHG3406-4 TaxID=2804575 RepID=UPI003CE7F57A